MKIFDDRIMLGLQKDMDYRQLRQDILTSNLANVDTPGYRPVDLDFSEQLKAILQSDDEKMTATAAGHAVGGETAEYGDPIIIAQKTEDGLDSNGVDLDQQMMELTDNSLRYRSSVKIISKKMALMRYVISGSNT